jgi:acetyltransferase-like isoleucine patch superfamily enzyme
MDPRQPIVSPGLFRRLLTRIRLRRCARVGPGTVALGCVWVRGAGIIAIGGRAVIDGGCAPVELHAGPGAVIRIGDDVRIGPGTSIEAMASVTIGDRCEIEPYCKILDNDFHGVHGDRTRTPPSRPVTVGDDAILRRRVIVLPGAAVRGGTVVPPATVVRGSASRQGSVPKRELG